LDLSVKLVKITNGRLKLGRTLGHRKPLALEQVNLELRDFSATSAFPFTLSTKVAGGGTIQLYGTTGPINPADSAMTPVKASLKVGQLDLAGSGMNDFAPDIAGLVWFEGSGSSDGRILQAAGKLKAEKLKLARTEVRPRVLWSSISPRSTICRSTAAHFGRAIFTSGVRRRT